MDLSHVTDYLPADDSALRGFRPGDRWLGGGSWLFSEPQPEVRRLLDLNAFGWTPLTVSEAGLSIAATCTLAELVDFRAPADWPAAALFAQCSSALLGSFKVWNTATVGGNVCLALPAGSMTSLTSALDGIGTVWTSSGEPRQMPITDLVTGDGTTALADGELLRSLFLPVESLRCRTAFRQFSLSPAGRSAVLVIGRRPTGEGPVVVTVTAATTRPVQLRFSAMPSAEQAQAALAELAVVYQDDVHGDPRWRARLTERYVGEVCQELNT